MAVGLVWFWFGLKMVPSSHLTPPPIWFSLKTFIIALRTLQ